MKRSGKFYRQNEAEVMNSLGLKPTKNSGSGWIEKEDGQNEYIIAQLKSTDAMSIRVDLKDIHTLHYNAEVAHKIPIFVIQYLATGEVYIQMKPEDIEKVAKYLKTGKCDIDKNIDLSDREETKIKVNKVVKSGNNRNREKFYNEREDLYKCRRR